MLKGVKLKSAMGPVMMTGIMLLCFQNCSPSKLEVSNESSMSPYGKPEFFNYNYKHAPVVYANMALIMPGDGGSDSSRFNFYGIVAPADGTDGKISYSVKITDEQGKTICVGQEGVLNSDQQNINFECLAASTLEKANVVMTTAFNGQREEFRATFSK